MGTAGAMTSLSNLSVSEPEDGFSESICSTNFVAKMECIPSHVICVVSSGDKLLSTICVSSKDTIS